MPKIVELVVEFALTLSDMNYENLSLQITLIHNEVDFSRPKFSKLNRLK